MQLQNLFQPNSVPQKSAFNRFGNSFERFIPGSEEGHQTPGGREVISNDLSDGVDVTHEGGGTIIIHQKHVNGIRNDAKDIVDNVNDTILNWDVGHQDFGPNCTSAEEGVAFVNFGNRVN